jgi:hypothetical protein
MLYRELRDPVTMNSERGVTDDEETAGTLFANCLEGPVHIVTSRSLSISELSERKPMRQIFPVCWAPEASGATTRSRTATMVVIRGLKRKYLSRIPCRDASFGGAIGGRQSALRSGIVPRTLTVVARVCGAVAALDGLIVSPHVGA